MSKSTSDNGNGNIFYGYADPSKEVNSPNFNFCGSKDPSMKFNAPSSMSAAGNKNPTTDMTKSNSDNGNGNIFYGYADPSKEVNSPNFNFYGYADPSKEFNAPSSMRAGNKNPTIDMTKNPSKELNAPSSTTGIPHRQHGNGAPSKEFQVGNVSINETIYFFQKDVRPGKMVYLPLFIAARDMTPFLPDRVAKSIPFLSDKLPEILKHFSVKPESRKADTINETIRSCERVAINGEEKYCATSLESFVDLSISKLGKKSSFCQTSLKKKQKPTIYNCQGSAKYGRK
ncbi:hypothetical protein DITRI_Ditri14bG0021300 [Diplodiscus trichospermus]